MKCFKCNSPVKESPHNKFTGFKSYRCTNQDCNGLFDIKDFQKKDNENLDKSLSYFEDLLDNNYPDQHVSRQIRRKTTGTHASGIVLAGSNTKSLKSVKLPSRKHNRPKRPSSVTSKRVRMVYKRFQVENKELNDMLEGGFEANRIYSFMEPQSCFSSISHFLVDQIVQKNSDYLIIDPLNIIHKINNKYNLNLDSFNPKDIEEAYNEVLKEKDSGKIILFLNMEMLVSELERKDPHVKRIGLSDKMHDKYIKVLSAELKNDTSLVLFSNSQVDRVMNNVRKHAFPIVEQVSYESFITSKAGLRGVAFKSRKSKASEVLSKVVLK